MTTHSSAPPQGVRDNFDAGSLSWVMGEIREALSRSKTAVFDAIQQDADTQPATLRQAKTFLHQAHGALQIVDIDGVAIITETSEDLLDRLESGQITLTQPVAQILDNAYQALVEYLEELLSGAPHQPVRLFPYYKSLLEVRSAERIHPADLFFPNLAIRPQLPPIDPSAFAESIDYVGLRQRFEKALLPFLRKNDPAMEAANARAMKEIVAQVERTQSNQQSRAFWWVLHAFAEAVAAGQIPKEIYVKQLFARINLQIRRLSEGSASIAERLLRDALFFIARVEQPSPRAAQVRTAYQLNGLVPVDYDKKRYGQVNVDALVLAKGRLSQAKNLWNRLAAGDGAAADAFIAEMKGLTEAVSKLGSQPLLKLLRELNGISRHAAANSQSGSMLGLEMATSLLFVENALANINRLSDDFGQRADAMTARLLSIVSGEAPTESAEWLDEMSKEAQQRQTMAALAGEMQNSLRQVEKLLDDFFREPNERTALSQIDPILHQIGGALAILDQDDALRAIRHTQESVRKFVEAPEGEVTDVAAFQHVAQNVGALSFFIETLQLQPESAKDRFSFDEQQGMFRANLVERSDSDAAQEPQVVVVPDLPGTDKPEAPEQSPAAELPPVEIPVLPTVEEELALRQQQSAELARSLSAEPSNPELQEQLKETLERVQLDAALVDNKEAGDRAHAAIELLESPDFVPTAESLAEIVTATAPIEPVIASAPASAPAAAPAPVSDEAVDAELLEIFLMEAVEVLECIHATLPQSRQEPSNKEHLTTLRRSFHTLKGSGRMVGLNAFGEAAWSIEQVLNLRLAETQGGDTHLYALLEKAAELLGGWVDDLQTQGKSACTPDGLVNAAERVKEGLPFSYEEQAVISQPVEEAAVAEQIEPVPDSLAIPEFILDEPALEAVEAAQVAEESTLEFTPDSLDIPELDLQEEPAELVAEAVPLETVAQIDDLQFANLLCIDGGSEAGVEAGPATEAAPAEDPLAGFALEVPDLSEIGTELLHDLPTDDVTEAEATDVPQELAPLDAEAVDVADAADAEQIIAALPVAEEEAVEAAALDQAADVAVAEESGEAENAVAEMDNIVEAGVADMADVLDAVLESGSDMQLPALASIEPVAETDVADVADATDASESRELPSAEIVDLSTKFAEPQRDAFAEQAQDATHVEEAMSSAPAMEIPQPVPIAEIIEFPSLQTATPARDDNVKRIGELEISVPLHNIYLAETDELVRMLSQDIAEWRHEPQRAVNILAVHAAHSLAGSSATVGFKSLQEVAHALEMVLQCLSRKPVGLNEEEFDILEYSIECLKQMLQKFALGEMPAHEPEQVQILARMQQSIEARASASLEAQLNNAAAEMDAQSDEPIELAAVELADSDPADVADLASDLTAASLDTAPEVIAELVDEAAVVDESENIAEPVAAPAPLAAVEPVAIEPEEEAPVSAAVMPAVTEVPIAPVEQSFAKPAEAAQEPTLAIKDELDADLLPVFLEEGRDMLPEIGEKLRAWQQNTSDVGLPQGMLRLLHTVKGSARMAGAMQLGQHMHEMETRIETIMRTGVPSQIAIDDLMSRYDHGLQLFEFLQNPDAPRPVPMASTPEAATAESVAERSGPVELQSLMPAIAGNFTPSMPAPALRKVAAPTAPVPLVRVRADILDRLVNQAGEVSISRSKLETEVGTLRSSLSELTENVARLRVQLREIEMQAESQITSRMSQTGERDFDPLEFDRFTRLQELTRMMAESVNDVGSVQQNLTRTVDSASDDLVAQARLTRDLQQDLMRVRMVQFASISERLYRVTRQASKELDKRVNLDIRGSSVEMDRSVLERMAGPFEHLLRNAIVHGIENKDKRRASGKSEIGELLVEIRQEGNEVVIQFSDDGQGLNVDRIRAKAEASGLLSDDMTESEITDLIFHPGFSTAESVTELAGRGVGMDVVRSEAAALGGRVAIKSEPGKGAQFTIHLPLTLAVTQVVILSTGGKIYAVPSVLVEQVQQLKINTLTAAYNDGAVVWQGQRVPMYYLSTLLGDREATAVAQQYTPLVIMKSGSDRVALHVDQVIGNREVVVKNIGPQLSRMIGIAGATVLGSGEIVLILNPVPLAQRAAHESVRAPRLIPSDAPEAMGAVAEMVASSPSAPKSEAVQGLRTQNIIMVVDDSLTVRRVTQRLLAREGYQVVLAKDGVDALEQLQSITPDVMLVDIEMPRMDGFDLTRNVRGDERTRHIPIIMITSRTATKHRNYAMELGVNEYLGKPYQEDDLLKSITGFINKETPVA